MGIFEIYHTFSEPCHIPSKMNQMFHCVTEKKPVFAVMISVSTREFDIFERFFSQLFVQTQKILDFRIKLEIIHIALYVMNMSVRRPTSGTFMHILLENETKANLSVCLDKN